jgi:hypothetical protein
LLRLFDSCGDHYDTAHIPNKWGPSCSNVAVTTDGRTGNGITALAATTPWYVQPQNLTISVGFYVGVACFIQSLAAGFLIKTAGGMGLKINLNGSVSVIDNTAAVVATSAAGLVVAGTWNYYTFSVSALTGTPTFSAYLNNSLTAVCSGTSTHVDASVSVLQVGDIGGVWSPTVPTAAVIDDFYVGDTAAGDGVTAPLGNVTAAIAMPDAIGQYSQFAVTGSLTPNWAAVSQIPPPGNANGVYSATIGNQDAYGVAQPANAPVVLGVQVVVDAKLAGGTILQLETGMGNGTAINYGSPWTPGSSYGMNIRTSALNPNTGLAWTSTDISQFQPAIEVTV